MSDEIKVGDWVVSKTGCDSFRVVGFSQSEFGLMLVDKWRCGHLATGCRKYNGATSALEAAEAATDAMMRDAAEQLL